MPLAGVFHVTELLLIELGLVDISPVEGRWANRKTWRHGAVGANDYVVLPSSAIPIGELELSIRVLHDARRLRKNRMHAAFVPTKVSNDLVLEKTARNFFLAVEQGPNAFSSGYVDR
jgi:hypothetical protein